MVRNNKNNMRSKFYFYLICKTLKKEKNEYYLKLVPYKNSYFQTDLNYKDLKLKIHMSLFAITESK